MANTSFIGPVRSENGFQSITVSSTSGAVTVDATYGANATCANLTASGTVIKLTGVPTADPHVVGQLWANSGVLTVSAG
jgi:hypothetical protein